MQARIVAPLVAMAMALTLLACPSSRTEGLDPSRVPENLRADYDRFAHKCSKCHTLARPLNAGITDDQQWVMYVNRMRRQPGSGISYEDQDVILRFLHWYAAEQRRVKAEKSGAPLASTSAPASAPPVAPVTPPSLATDAGALP